MMRDLRFYFLRIFLMACCSVSMLLGMLVPTASAESVKATVTVSAIVAFDAFGGDGVIDNFDVNSPAYNPLPEGTPPTLSSISPGFQGSNALHFAFNDSAPWQGAWKEVLRESSVTTGKTGFRLYVRGDGTRHRLQLEVISGSNKYVSPTLYTSSTSWEEIRVPFSKFSPTFTAGTQITGINLIFPAADAGDPPSYAKQFFKVGSFQEIDIWSAEQFANETVIDRASLKPVSGGLTLTWSSVGASSYRIYRSVDLGQYDQVATVSGTSYTDGSVSSGRRYQYKVASVDSAGQEGPKSNPSNSVVYGADSFVLNESEGYAGAELYYFQNESVYGSTSPTNIVYDHSTFAPGKSNGSQSYKVSMEGYQPNGWAAWQMEFPNALDLSDFSVLRFWVKGNGTSNALKFDVLASDPNFPETFYAWKYNQPIYLMSTDWTLVEIPVQDLEWDPDALDVQIPEQPYDGKNIKRYGFTYLATNTSGGTYSIDLFDATNTLQVDNVTNMKVVIKGKEAQLSWTNPTDQNFAGIRIVYRTDRAPQGPDDGTIALERAASRGASDSFTHEGLETGKTYYYAIYAYDVGGRFASGATASEVTVSSDGEPPVISSVKVNGVRLDNGDILSSKPTITATLTDNESSIDTTSLRITFEASTGSKIEVGAADIDYNTVTSIMTYIREQAIPDGTYTLKIEAKDGAGNLTTETVTDLKVNSGDVSLVGRPFNQKNPFDPVRDGGTTMKYTLTVDSDITLYLYDLNAHLIWKRSYSAGANGGKAGDNEVFWKGANDFGNTVGNGVYILKIVSTQGGTKKVIGTVKIAVIR